MERGNAPAPLPKKQWLPRSVSAHGSAGTQKFRGTEVERWIFTSAFTFLFTAPALNKSMVLLSDAMALEMDNLWEEVQEITKRNLVDDFRWRHVWIVQS